MRQLYWIGFFELENVPFCIKSHHYVCIDRSPTIMINSFAFGMREKMSTEELFSVL